jgi:hypothetical protein
MAIFGRAFPIRGVTLLRQQSASAQTLIASLFTDTDAFYAPSVSAIYYLTPDIYDDSANDTFYAPSISANNTLTPDLFSDSDVFYSPSISASDTLTPGLFSDTDTFYQPTAAPGAVTLSPDLYDDSANDAFYAPSVSSYESLTPNLFTDSDTVYSPTVTPGAVSLSPDLYSDDDTFYAPSIGQRLNPALFSDADTFYSPTITTLVTLTASLFTDTDIFYAPYVAIVQYLTVDAVFVDSDIIYSPSASVIDFIRPNLVASDDAFYQHTLMGGAAVPIFVDQDIFYSPTIVGTLKPSLFTDADAFYAPTIGAVIAPHLVIDADAFYPPVAILSNTLAPDIVIDIFENFFSTNVSQAILPSLVVDNDSIYFTTVIGSSATLHPPLVVDVDLFGSPSVLRQKKTGQGGGSNPGDVANQKYVSRIVMPENGLVTALEVVSKGAQTDLVRMLIYAADGPGGAPGTLMSKTGDISAEPNGINTLSLLTPVSAARGTVLWVGLQGAATFKWNLAPQVGGSYYNNDLFTDGPTNPFGTATADNQIAPVFIIYLQGATAQLTPALYVDLDVISSPSAAQLIIPANNVFPSFLDETESVWPAIVSTTYGLLSAIFDNDDVILPPDTRHFNLLSLDIFEDSDAIFNPFIIIPDWIVSSAQLDSDDVVYGATVTPTGAILQPSQVVDDDSVYMATVLPSPGVVGSANVQDGDTVYPPAVVPMGALVQPPLVDESGIINAARVNVGSVFLLVNNTYNDTDIFYTPTLVPSVVNLTPELVNQDDEFLDSPFGYENDVDPIFEIDPDADDFYDASIFLQNTLLPNLVDDGADLTEHIYDTDVFRGPGPTEFPQYLYPDLVISGDTIYGAFDIGPTVPSVTRFRLKAIFDTSHSGKSSFGNDKDLQALFNTESSAKATFDNERDGKAIFNTTDRAKAIIGGGN